MQYNWENICRDLSVFIGLRYSWGNVAYIYWIAISWGNVDENCIYLLNWGNVLHIFIGLRYSLGKCCIYLLGWGNVLHILLDCDIFGKMLMRCAYNLGKLIYGYFTGNFQIIAVVSL